MYKNCSTAIQLQSTGLSFNIKRGVKQGKPLTPNLFTSTLEEVFKKVASQWEDVGIAVGEMKLTNLRFVDDTILFLYPKIQDLSRSRAALRLDRL